MLEIIVLATAAAVALVAVAATFICIKANKKEGKKREQEFENKLELRREQVSSSLVTPFQVANDYKVMPLTVEEKNSMMEYGVVDVEIRVYNNEPVTLYKRDDDRWYIENKAIYHDKMYVYTLPGYIMFLQSCNDGEYISLDIIVNTATGQSEKCVGVKCDPSQSGLMENGVVMMCETVHRYNSVSFVKINNKRDNSYCHQYSLWDVVTEGIRMFIKDIAIIPTTDNKLILLSLKKEWRSSSFKRWIKLKKNIYLLIGDNGFSVFDAKQFKDKWFEGCTYKYNHKDGLEVINPDSMPLAYKKFCLKEWELDPKWKKYRNKFNQKDYAKSIIGV